MFKFRLATLIHRVTDTEDHVWAWRARPCFQCGRRTHWVELHLEGPLHRGRCTREWWAADNVTPALRPGDQVEICDGPCRRLATVKTLGNATGPLVVVPFDQTQISPDTTEKKPESPRTEAMTKPNIGTYFDVAVDTSCGCGGEYVPSRDDAVAAWLRTRRDQNPRGTDDYGVIDGLLEDYRLHADTRMSLDRHACEGAACEVHGKLYQDEDWHDGATTDTTEDEE